MLKLQNILDNLIIYDYIQQKILFISMNEYLGITILFLGVYLLSTQKGSAAIDIKHVHDSRVPIYQQ